MDFKTLEQKIAERRVRRKELYEKHISRLKDDYERAEAKDEANLQSVKATGIEITKKKDALDHEAYLYERDRKQRLKNEANTPKRRMLKAKEDARQNIKRDIKMGLTSQQITRKYLDEKATIREQNKDAERETNKMLKFTNLSKFKVNLDDLT